jgi:amino acid permease
MTDSISNKNDDDSKSNQSEHIFHVMPPASGALSKDVPIVNSKETIYQKTEGAELVEPEAHEQKKKSTIFGASFMLTNLCLGTTIFTFAVRAKAFGLVWFLITCCVVAVVNYWSIMKCVIASSRCPKKDDYSEITEEILGKKMRIVLNVFIILYSYGFCMCYLALVYSLFGRFIYSAGYSKDYMDYLDFFEKVWGRPYIKFPFYAGIAFFISLMCLIKDINKLNFSAYIGVAACIYGLFVVMIECHSYYQYYKEERYVESDKSTHANWIDLGQAFTKKLDFFKGISTLFAAYACHPGIFPVYAGFKFQEGQGIRKMKLSTFFGTLLTTALHIISITCAYLTDPITPEDLIVYRKNKGTGKDIAMVIAKLLVSISLIFTFPGYYFTLRLSIANSFTGGKISNKFNYIITFCSCFGCAIVAAVYDKILNYLNYIGGFLSVFICYLNPNILCIYSSGKPITYWKNLLDLSVSIILSIIGIIAGILTIIDDVSN